MKYNFWQLGRKGTSQDHYNVSRIILLVAAGITQFLSPYNHEKAIRLGVLKLSSGQNKEKYLALATKICLFYERFDNYPSDKLALEWLAEEQT